VAYTDLNALKTYLGIAVEAEDTLLERLIHAASAAVDSLCHRRFAAASDETRRFDALLDTDGRSLFLDADLCALTAVVNGDGQALDAGDLLLLPRTGPPWHELRLKRSALAWWTYDDTPENAIAVTGRWAYSATPPADIEQAAVRLAAFFYRQKDAPDWRWTTAATPQWRAPELPPDVLALLAPYRRIAV